MHHKTIETEVGVVNMEIVAAAGAFITLFSLWVVVPKLLIKNR